MVFLLRKTKKTSVRNFRKPIEATNDGVFAQERPDEQGDCIDADTVGLHDGKAEDLLAQCAPVAQLQRDQEFPHQHSDQDGQADDQLRQGTDHLIGAHGCGILAQSIIGVIQLGDLVFVQRLVFFIGEVETDAVFLFHPLVTGSEGLLVSVISCDPGQEQGEQDRDDAHQDKIE